MNKMKQLVTVCLAILFIGGVSCFDRGSAAEQTGGGQVSSKSKITFFEGDKPSSKPAPGDKPATGVELPKTGKVIGKLPQTGEASNRLSLIGGIWLVLVVMFSFFRKKEKGDNYVK